ACWDADGAGGVDAGRAWACADGRGSSVAPTISAANAKDGRVGDILAGSGFTGSGKPQNRVQLGNERPYLRVHLIRYVLLKIVARGQSFARHVRRVVAPDRQDVVEAAHRAALAPERHERTCDPLPTIGFVVLEIDRRAGAVVLAHRVDVRGI